MRALATAVRVGRGDLGRVEQQLAAVDDDGQRTAERVLDGRNGLGGAQPADAHARDTDAARAASSWPTAVASSWLSRVVVVVSAVVVATVDEVVDVVRRRSRRRRTPRRPRSRARTGRRRADASRRNQCSQGFQGHSRVVRDDSVDPRRGEPRAPCPGRSPSRPTPGRQAVGRRHGSPREESLVEREGVRVGPSGAERHPAGIARRSRCGPGPGQRLRASALREPIRSRG